jgi:hypothetical protein
LEGFAKLLGESLHEADHVFQFSDNFGVHNGRLKLIDYGGKRTVQLILGHREKIVEAFDELNGLL